MPATTSTADDAHVQIGDLAKRSGVTARTLRHYEEQGLIAPCGRDPNGYRYYDASLVKEIHVITMMLSLGLSLRQVRYIHFDAAVTKRPEADELRERMGRALEAYHERLEQIETETRALAECRAALLDRIVSCESTLARNGFVYPELPDFKRRIRRAGRVVYERNSRSTATS